MRSILAFDDVVSIRWMGSPQGTESGKIERADLFVLDVTKRTIRTERAEAARVVQTSWEAQWRGGRDVKVRAVLALWTDSPPAELLTLALVSEIEGVREFALVAFLTQAALVVFADQMADAAPLLFGYIMSIRTGRTSGTVAFDEVLAERLFHLGRGAERRQCLPEEVVEMKGRPR